MQADKIDKTWIKRKWYTPPELVKLHILYNLCSNQGREKKVQPEGDLFCLYTYVGTIHVSTQCSLIVLGTQTVTMG